MLGVSKKEIISFMTSNEFEWREDASNLDTTYKRNAIRQDLVPVLAGLAGSQEALYKYDSFFFSFDGKQPFSCSDVSYVCRRIEDIGAQSIQLKSWLQKEVTLGNIRTSHIFF